jgi:hypothetical protein
MFKSNTFFSDVNRDDPFDDAYYEEPVIIEGEQSNLEEFAGAPSMTLEEQIDEFGMWPTYAEAIKIRDLPEDINKVRAELRCLRKSHSIVNYSGMTFVHWKDSLEGMQFQKPGDFHTYNANKLVPVAYQNAKGEDRTREVSITKEFMKDPFVKRYEGVEFVPGKGHDNFLNFWKGWKLAPKFSDTAYFHLLIKALCNDDSDCNEYLMNYLAHMVQKPEEKPEVAIVMKGSQGIGKGTLMKLLSKFNDNYKHLSSTQSLTGQFSGHLLDAFVVFADEAVWGGDKVAEGRLKAMITESMVSIRALHKDEVYVRSFVRLFVASNENWVVPVGEGDRRYFVLECDPRYKGKTAPGEFFHAFGKWMNNGGAEAVFYELLHRDISNFNPRVFPVTQARLDMQVRSLPTVERFVYELLNGQLMLGKGTAVLKDGKWHFGKSALHSELIEWCNTHKKHYIPTQDELSMSLGKHLDFSADDVNWRKNWKRTVDGTRENCYQMCNMDVMRERFSKSIFNADAEKIFSNYKNQ